LGIALVAANVSKLPVVLLDSSENQLNKGVKFMGKGRIGQAMACNMPFRGTWEKNTNGTVFRAN
jgi:3-hydroxyacyl-CoA dehydrogenase